MSAIAAANSLASNAIALLLSNAASAATATGTPVTKATTSLLSNTASAAAGADSPTNQPTAAIPTKSSRGDPIDLLDLSDSAKATADTPSATILTLSSGATSKATGAASKSFAGVTADARAMLTANQAAMKASGHALGMGENQGTQADVDAAFTGLDRRSLFAIASNSEGLFTDVEQEFAQSTMSQQQAAAMGLNNTSGFMRNPSAGYLSGIGFLDSASPEEKASDNWRVNRASLQASYESNFRDDHPGDLAENVDSGDPIVNLLARVIQNAKGTWSSTTDGSYVTDVSKITLFAGGKHDAALQQARSQLGKNEQSRFDLTV